MRKKSRQRQQNNIMPVILIVSGIVLALAVLIWQLTRSNGAQGIVPSGDPATSSEIERITLANAKQAFDQNQAVFLDVRPSDSYQAGHIPGAVNIPLDELENRLSELNPNQWIITYCT